MTTDDQPSTIHPSRPITPGDADPTFDTDHGATEGHQIPIIVWRTRNVSPDASSASAGVTQRLADGILSVYTRQGDAVVDFDADPHLRNAAHARRSHLSRHHPVGRHR